MNKLKNVTEIGDIKILISDKCYSACSFKIEEWERDPIKYLNNGDGKTSCLVSNFFKCYGHLLDNNLLDFVNILNNFVGIFEVIDNNNQKYKIKNVLKFEFFDNGDFLFYPTEFDILFYGNKIG